MIKTMPSSGGLHPKASCEMKELYKNLFNVVKNVFPEKELSQFFPMEGYRYNEFTQIASLEKFEKGDNTRVPAVRLMIVGRCVNGWTELSEKTDEEFASSAIDTIIPGGNGFDWLDNNGLAKDFYTDEEGKRKRYNVNKSAFFRCIRGVIHEMKPEASIDPRWFEHIVWTNLYTVAPLYKGNATGKLQDVQVEVSRKIMLEQIKHYKPTHILFITDWDWWFERFVSVFPDVKKIGDSKTDNVVGIGYIGDIKAVVSIRPDRTKPNKPNEGLFISDIVKSFKR